MNRTARASLLIAICLWTFCPARAAEPLEWNVLLKEWQVAGPFPTVDDGALGLDTDFIGWQGAPTAEPTAPAELPPRWTPPKWTHFRTNTMHTVEDPNRRNVLFYAATAVTVEKETPAILAFGAHQSVVVWHGTKEIFRLMSRNRSRMDNFKVNVVLQPGENWFLFKTHSEIGAQRVLARFLPPKITKPLVAFRYVGTALDSLPQEFPDINLAFLDKKGGVIERHRVSGNVSLTSELAFYSLFAAAPKRKPNEVEIRFADHPEAAAQRFPWGVARAATVDFNLAIPQTYRVEMIIPAGLEVFDEQRKSLPYTADAGGITITANSVPVIVQEFELIAPGHEARRCRASPSEPAKVGELNRGCALRGKIVGSDGSPRVGTKVRVLQMERSLSRAVTTDEAGRFSFPGLGLNRQVAVLIAPPGDGPGLITTVTIGEQPEQELEGKIEIAPAPRVRGTLRQGKKVPALGRIVFSGSNVSFVEPVAADGSFDVVLPPSPILSVTGLAPDLRPERKLVDLQVPISLQFDFALEPGPPALVEFLRADGTRETALFPNVAFPDGPMQIPWIGLGNGKFVFPNFPKILAPVSAFSNRAGRFTGTLNGPGEYQIYQEDGRIPIGLFDQ